MTTRPRYLYTAVQISESCKYFAFLYSLSFSSFQSTGRRNFFALYECIICNERPISHTLPCSLNLKTKRFPLTVFFLLSFANGMSLILMLDLTFSWYSKVLFKSLAEIVLCLATLRQFLLICVLHVAAAVGVGSGCAEGNLSAEHFWQQRIRTISSHLSLSGGCNQLP